MDSTSCLRICRSLALSIGGPDTIALPHMHIHRYDKPTVKDILGSPYHFNASAGKSTYMTVRSTAIFLLFPYALAKIYELEKRIRFMRHNHLLAVASCSSRGGTLVYGSVKALNTSGELQVI